jgi:hypothetical protein
MDKRHRAILLTAREILPTGVIIGLITRKRGHPHLRVMWPDGRELRLPFAGSPSCGSPTKAFAKQLTDKLNPDGTLKQGTRP